MNNNCISLLIGQLKSRKKVLFDLLILAFLASLPFFLHGTYLVFNSLLDPVINPVYLWQRELFLWNSKELAGTITGWGTSFLFPVTSFFAFFSLFKLPIVIVERIGFVFIYFLSGAAMYYLTSVIVPQKYRIARIIAGMAFMYNLYIFVTTQGAAVLLLPYATLPLLLGLYIRGLNAEHYMKYAILLGFTSTIMSFISPPLVLINVIVLVLFLIFHIAQKPKNLQQIIKFNGFSLLFCVLLNMWIILPISHYVLTAYTVQAPVIFSETASWISSQSSFSEILRLLGAWYFYGTGAPGVLNFSYSPFFRSNLLFIFTSFLIPILASLAFLIKPKSKHVIFFGILLLIFIPMAVAIYPPQNPSFTGKIYLWIMENIPYINILLKDNHKFVAVLALSYSFLLGILANESYLHLDKKLGQLTKFKRIKKIAKMAPAFLVICVILINAFPIITGNLFYEPMKINIPDYWNASVDWINNQKDDFRILELPEQNIPCYTWGSGGDPALSLYSKSIICTYPATASPSLNLINQIYDGIRKNSTIDLEILRSLNVKYILQRNDFEWPLSRYQHSPEFIQSYLNSQKGIHLEKTFGQLQFYVVDNFVPRHIYVDAGDIKLKFNVVNNEANGVQHDYLINATGASVSFVVPVDGAYTLLVKQSEFIKLQDNPESIVLDIDGNSIRVGYQIVNDTDTWVAFNKIDLTQGNHTIRIGIDLILPLSLTGFDAGEDWKGITGDVSVDTINFKEGRQGLMLYQGFSCASIADKNVSLDLATGSSPSDRIDFWVYVDNATNLNQLGIIFGTSPELSEYYVYWVTKGISDGWNYISIPKSNFTDNAGHANWAKVSTVRVMAYANSNGMVKVTFDDLVMASSGFDAIIRASDIIPPDISYTLLNPTKYIVHVANATTPYFLTFSESYDQQWQAFINERGQTGWLESLFQEPVNEHFLGNGYANSWYITKTGTYEITLEYSPQKLFYLGLIISLVTLILSVLYIARRLFYPKTLK